MGGTAALRPASIFNLRFQGLSMTGEHASIAKITRPSAAGIFARKRLFRLLDTCRKYPVIWITGPAGSGKTTLVSSYLDANKLPCLWYQVDEGDWDIATFFSYIGMAARKAAPRRRTPSLFSPLNICRVFQHLL